MIDLLDHLLVLAPEKRPTAKIILEDPWFTSDPLPLKPGSILPINVDCHEYEVRKTRESKQRSHVNTTLSAVHPPPMHHPLPYKPPPLSEPSSASHDYARSNFSHSKDRDRRDRDRPGNSKFMFAGSRATNSSVP
ncbi:hypothetical protein HMI54_013516 [Coelomomyces lativittatus]|nr:hypothetical protein HMI54_013516 [Coelomomyces lativittatus]KAJ1508585.1 hypothetical protein HMI56_007213 [Coelomomyces lativittatus]